MLLLQTREGSGVGLPWCGLRNELTGLLEVFFDPAKPGDDRANRIPAVLTTYETVGAQSRGVPARLRSAEFRFEATIQPAGAAAPA